MKTVPDKHCESAKNKWLRLVVIMMTTALATVIWCMVNHTLGPKLSMTQSLAQPSEIDENTLSAPDSRIASSPETPDWVIKDYLTPNEYARPQTPLTKVNGVVVHYTGNPGTTALQNRSYFENLGLTGETSASSHFIIDIDGTVIQCIPLNEIAYCSNQRNNDTIAIECCHPDETGQFTDETYNSLIRLLDWLVENYELNPQTDVIRHYDVTQKICPKYYVENPDAWEQLLADLQ